MDLAHLPVDVIDRILVSLPDFKTLSAVIRTSKSIFYDVFQNHPVSITRAIAHNVAGPCLVQALRIAYTDYALNCTNGGFKDIAEEDDVLDRPLTRYVSSILERNMEAARGLENLFSLRYKDKAHETSQLTYEESSRFLQALHRISLGTTLIFMHKEEAFDPFEEYEEDDDDADDDDDDDGDDTTPEDRRGTHLIDCVTQLYGTFNATDLKQIYDVALFLCQVNNWVVSDVQGFWPIARSPNWQDSIILDPTALWVAWSTHVRVEDTASSFASHWEYACAVRLVAILRGIMEEKKLNSQRLKDARMGAILDTVEGEHDTCGRCHDECGLQLWGTTNIELWRRSKSMKDLTDSFLPGLLRSNMLIVDWIKKSLLLQRDDTGNRIFDMNKLASEIFELANDSDSGSWVWDQDHWYCTACVDTVFKENLWKWLLAEKKKRGETIPEDCWYGYNCRTMTHKPEHAGKLNHLWDIVYYDSQLDMYLSIDI
ncbi:hypothetical protein EIP91_002382 [Steccherinum ochraceum]|uniref:Uncharacterized protein n=1 Tax=Steccherinum ochraceum TaxID=92696 RepID=A0A4R0RPM7_9APHY|nr:hypothetical protein EIP91_002382 [Steccherinum ochraceum]